MHTFFWVGYKYYSVHVHNHINVASLKADSQSMSSLPCISCELHCEFSQPLHITSILNLLLTWLTAFPYGKLFMPVEFTIYMVVQLIDNLHQNHQNMTSRVRVNGRLSSSFATTTDACHLGVLAPVLFCIAVELILGRCM